MELEYNLIEKFADPDLMMGMSVADKLKATAVTGLMGLGVTFIVLIVLMLIITLLRRQISRYEMNLEYRRQVQRARKLRRAKLYKCQEAERHGFETVGRAVRGAHIENPAPPAACVPAVNGRRDDAPDEETAAVIMAAICAYEGRPADEIRIRKIVRRPYEEAAWRAGAGDGFGEQEGWNR